MIDVYPSVTPTYYTGTISAAAVNVVGLIDGSGVAVLDLQHRGTLGQFKFTILVEGTDDSTATGNEAAGAASTAVGWTSLEVRSATGGEMSSIVLGGRYLLYNAPRKVRIRCSSYTFGTAQIDVMTKPVSQQDPSRTLSDKDALASLAMTTFGQAQVAQRTYLAGANFDEGSLDTDVWSNLNSGTGSHAFSGGFIELHTGTGSTGVGGVRSLNLATVLGAADNAITIRNSISSVTDGAYVYRFGVYTATEGTFVQLGGNARTITDAVFNATTTMTSATAAFTAADLGKRITSSGNVTIGTTITKIVSSTSVLLSAAALTSASGQTVDIEGFGVSYVNRTGGVDTTSPFGVIGFSTPTISASGIQIWEITFNPNFLIVRNSGNFVQLQIGSSVLAPMFSQYDLPLTAEAINLGSTTDHVLYIQTLIAERLGQQHTIRANESFDGEDVLAATAAVIQAQKPDGDFAAIGSNDVGHLYVAPEFDTTIDTFESTSGWTALNGDTTNIATTTNHVRGASAITFDKADTAANSLFACIQKTITALDLSQQAKSGLLGGQFYISDTTNVAYAFVRLGTDSSNYNEWRISVDDIISGEWNSTTDMILNQPSHAGNTGNGWNPTSVTYIAVGVAFNLQSNTLTGIVWDSIFAFTVQHTQAQIATSVSTPNINLNQVKGTTTAVNAGNNTNGTLRVVEATNSQLNTTMGDTGDAEVAAGAVGSVSAKLRRLTDDLGVVKSSVIADDSAFTPASDKVMMAGFTNDSVSTDTVDEGDAGAARMSRRRVIFHSAETPLHVSSSGTPIVATTTGVISAPGAGNHLRIYRIHFSNGGSTSCWVSVRDGAAGTQYYTTYMPQNAVVSLNLNASGVLDLTSATRLDIVLSAAGSVEYTIDYLTVPD